MAGPLRNVFILAPCATPKTVNRIVRNILHTAASFHDANPGKHGTMVVIKVKTGAGTEPTNEIKIDFLRTVAGKLGEVTDCECMLTNTNPFIIYIEKNEADPVFFHNTQIAISWQENLIVLNMSRAEVRANPDRMMQQNYFLDVSAFGGMRTSSSGGIGEAKEGMALQF